MEEDESLEVSGESVEEEEDGEEGGFFDFLWTPIDWFKMLADETHWSFVFGVLAVYGISQGFGGAFNRVGTEYYMKDVQKVQPSESQIYQGIISSPLLVKPLWGILTDVLPIFGYRRRPYIILADLIFWGIISSPLLVKPLWGILTDVLPIFGYRRRPYIILAGLLSMVSMLLLSLHEDLHLIFALLSLTAGSAGVAIADVTIDACVAQNSNTHPSIAADMQSLCAVSYSVGALLGFSLSGIFVHLIGPQGVLGLLSVPAGLVVLAGILLDEPLMPNFNEKQVYQKFVAAGKAMWTTLKFPDVWRPCIYMYLSLALSINIHEGLFYWYTDAKGGPSLSQDNIGFIFSVGSIGYLLAALLYQNILKDHPFRNLLLWTQLIYGLSGMLDFMLVLRLNLKFGIPDYFFIVIDECVSQMIGRLRWMPILVLSSKLCPPGIEGTFFALLMSIDNFGLLSSSWAGGLVLHSLNITRTRFDNLWVAVLVRNILRVTPLCLLFLIPGGDPSALILPTDILAAKERAKTSENERIELLSLVSSVDG